MILYYVELSRVMGDIANSALRHKHDMNIKIILTTNTSIKLTRRDRLIIILYLRK